MEQIKIENGIITDHIGSPKLYDGYTIVNNFRGTVGDPVKWYDENFQKYSDSYLYGNGLKELPFGYLFDKEKNDLRQMTEVERIQNGIGKMPKGFKIVDDELVQKTMLEQFKAHDIGVEEYSEYQRNIRDGYLMQTDKYMLIDFPIDDNLKLIIKDYRQYLRDLPKDPKFPDIEIKTPPIP